MELSECLADDVESKIKLTEDMVEEIGISNPEKASELRGQLYSIQVILNEIEDEYLELKAHTI
ncbi:MAG TPA: hypothetical protein VJ991_00680 [Balneolales bacterium]|nr:hypothetical protein [Balneolales bacterium]